MTKSNRDLIKFDKADKICFITIAAILLMTLLVNIIICISERKQNAIIEDYLNNSEPSYYIKSQIINGDTINLLIFN